MFRLSWPVLASLLGTSLSVLLASPPAFAQAVAERVAAGLTSPVFATSPPGDLQRLFILEQPGRIRILKAGTLLTQPFLDIQGLVNNGGNEQGLLGLAFHPQYATNGYFYVYYTAGSGAGNVVIERYSVTSNPDSANAGSALRILSIAEPFTNHNGGHIEFGPDGYLYAGPGDGGSGGDPADRAQNGMVLLGKMLRIDVNGDDFPADPNRNYAIPPSNPFAGNPSFLDEIWAWGMRNPYRFSFDRLTGDLWIGDVGQNCWEEIDFQPASSAGGENYGWDTMEGLHCFNESNFNDCNNGPCNTGFVDPILEYSHGGSPFRCSLTGGVVYRGSAIPAIQGAYFYADYCSNQIWSLRYAGGTVTDLTDWTATLDPPTTNINSIVAFGQDGAGEMYIVDRGGEVFKVLPDPASAVGEPEVAKPSTLELGAARPNPFTGATTFDVRLDRPANLRVSVYTAAGRLVRRLHDGPVPAGALSLEWRGKEAGDGAVPSGVYFLRAEAGGRVATKRVTLLR